MLPNRSFFLAAVMLMLMATATGCVKPWNTAHAALEITAEAVTQTDELVATSMGPAHEEARTEVVAAAREARQTYEQCVATNPEPSSCEEPPPVETFMERYEEAVRTWDVLTSAIGVMRETLLVAETAVTTWRDTKEQPGNWAAICRRIGEAQEAIVRAIEACGVDVPAMWEGALSALEPICAFIAPDPVEGDTP